MGLGQIISNILENNTTENVPDGGLSEYWPLIPFAIVTLGLAYLSYRLLKLKRELKDDPKRASEPFYLFRRKESDVKLEDEYDDANFEEYDDYDSNFGRQPRIPQ